MPDFSPPYASCPTDRALRSMFRARKRVFVDLLKWDVPVLEDEYEMDQFDTFDAAYLILADNDANHRASARLLQTDRPHILGSLFPVLCEGPVPSGEGYREITRFCIEPTLPRSERRLVRDQLVTALAEHALATGLIGYTAVANRAWFDQIAKFGWTCSSLGPIRSINGVRLTALQIDIDETTIAGLRSSGIYRPAPFRTARIIPEYAS